MQLIDIQKLQFSDKPAAESMLLAFLKANEDSSIERVELRPKPESLNSLNGFVHYPDGERLFFKTHVEENEQVSEYYNSTMLAKAGYPVISAKQITHRPGRQIALYEVVTLPTLFDLLKIEEDNQLGGHPDSDLARALLTAQDKLDTDVFAIYNKTLKYCSVPPQTDPPIHQLFHHRLQENGRLGLFYRGKAIPLDGSATLKFDDLASMRWTINGVRYTDTLSQIIERSRRLLAPQASFTVIGHGDAHNGNIFVNQETNSLHMFDPAFAGEHNILLDLTKPLFHNIFARWMYFPEQVSDEFDLTYKISNGEIIIEHDFLPSKMRLAHLQSKKTNLLQPTLTMLQEQLRSDCTAASADWREFLRASLFCCPFLTVNLFAPHVANGTLAERYSLAIKMLGLSMAVSFGSLSHHDEDGLSAVIDSLFEV